QSVVTLQPRPAVRTLEKARVEGRAQPGVTGEVADGSQAQPRRLVASHGERVRVVEAQGVADENALGAERRPHGADRRESRVLEDRVGDRARVFRIDVDGPA